MTLLSPPTRSKSKMQEHSIHNGLTWPLMWIGQPSSQSVSLIGHTGFPILKLGTQKKNLSIHM